MSTTDGLLFIISAPSGAGKTSLVKALIEHELNLSVATSHTTRAKRSTEQDGQDYYFVDMPEFKDMIAQGAFLEHAHVFGHCYGTTKAEVLRLRSLGKDVILEIDWQGAEQLMAEVPCVSIFILPPSLAALQERLTTRAQDAQSSIEQRLAAAKHEIQHYPEYDYLLINDDFDAALSGLRSIIQAERHTTSHMQQKNAALIAGMLDDTEA